MRLLNLFIAVVVLHVATSFRIPNFQRFVNNYKANLLFTSYNPTVTISKRDMNAFASSINSDSNIPISKAVAEVPRTRPNFFRRLSTSLKFVLQNAGRFVLYGTQGMVSWANFTAEASALPSVQQSSYYPSIYWFSPYNNGTGKAEQMSKECVDRLSPQCLEFATKVEKMNKDMAEKAKLSGEKPRSFAVGIAKRDNVILPTAYSAALNKKPPTKSDEVNAPVPSTSRRIEVRTVTKSANLPAIKTVETVKESSSSAKTGSVASSSSIESTPSSSSGSGTTAPELSIPVVTVVTKTKKPVKTPTPRTTASPAVKTRPGPKPTQPKPTAEEDRKLFQVQVKALLAYQRLYGDFKVPVHFIVPSHEVYPKDTHGLNLGSAYMSLAKSKSLEQYKKDRLTAIGFFK